MYKQASKLGLRFQTTKGLLSVEQLWTLGLSDLKNIIKSVKKVLNKDNDDELSFLEESKIVDVENELRFNILKDIYLTKQSEIKESKDAVAIKQHNQKIDELIFAKQNEKLASMSIEELEALRK